MLRSVIQCFVRLAILSGVCGLARADGLVQQLPEDGSWVRFELTLERLDPKSGQVLQKSVGWQTVSSVGKLVLNDETCRLIELKYELKASPESTESYSEAAKIAVPESKVSGDESVLDHRRKAWLQTAGGGARGRTPAGTTQFEIDTRSESNFRYNLRFQLPGQLAEVRKLDPKTIEWNDRRLLCAGISGRTEAPFSNPNTGGDEFSYEIRLHKDIPFGVVSQRCDWRRRGAEGQLIAHRVWTFTLAEVGKDAKSSIPDVLYPVLAFRLQTAAERDLENGDYDRAIANYTRAIPLAPTFALLYDGRGRAYAKIAEFDKALADFRESIRRDPKWSHSAAHLAWLLATCPEEKHRDGKQAVEHATRACELSEWKNAEFLSTLAAAHAEVRDFEQALKWQTKALELAPEKEKPAHQARLELLQAGKPIRDESAK
jgi:tetratricopeptide (TPR) repeat protein